MDPQRLKYLTSAAALQRVPDDFQLFQEGDRPDFLHVLLHGHVELYSEHADHTFGFSLLRPYSVFILASALLGAPYLNSAATLEESLVVLIPVEAFRKAMETDVGLARAVEAEAALAYRRILKELKNQKFRPAGERLANWLLREMTPNGSGGIVRLPFSRRKLASHIGTTPETLSRLFAELAAYGVHGHFHDVLIDDPVALAGFAGPDPLIDGQTD